MKRMQPLAALLRAAGLPAGPRGPRVAGLTQDSRKVKAGWAFVAVPSASGKHADAGAHLRQAAARGACLLVASASALRSARLEPGAPALAVPDPAAALAALAAAWSVFPARKLALHGVTGTNGKTTTSFLLRGLLKRPSALLGTVGYWVGARFHEAPNTTPSSLELQALFAEAVAAGCKAAVMEVSSHALDQGRVDGLRFRSATFTNLTRDHLDYHKTLAAYGAAKARLFALLQPGGVAVVNAQDPWSKRMAAARPRGARLLRYHAAGGRAELRALGLRLEMDGTTFTLDFEGRRRELRLPLPGRFNVANALAAAGAALALGAGLEAVAQGLERPSLPPGRFEMLRAGQPFNVVVDYAHTPDALERLIGAAREVTPGRVITVFGCGGDRDRGKRPMMGALSARLSDLSVATSDNPRTEDPAAILRQILAGVPAARPGDSVLIAGKGHEDYQIVGEVKHPFDDRVQARRALAGLGFKGRR